MVYCGFNSFYTGRYFAGGCRPFNSCCGNGFGTGFKLGILSYLSGMSSPFSMNIGFGFGINQGYQMPSYSAGSTPSVFSYGNSSPSYSYIPPVNTTTFGDILRMYSGNSGTNYNNYNNQSKPFDFDIFDTEETSKSEKSSKSSKSKSSSAAAQTVTTDFKMDKAFINRVKEIAKNLNCDYKDLLAVMNSESGINPQTWNGKSAVGLIQFTDIALTDYNKTYGTSYTKDDVSKMSGMEQLDLVENFLTTVKKRKFSSGTKLSAGDLYALVFAPSRANQEVLYTSGSDAYAKNPLDLDGDRKITKTDLANHLKKKQVNLVA